MPTTLLLVPPGFENLSTYTSDIEKKINVINISIQTYPGVPNKRGVLSVGRMFSQKLINV